MQTRFWLVLVLLLLWLSACGPIVPATTPPQLENTPGAFIRLDEARVIADTFTMQYPVGWRVVKSNPAIEETRLVFVSPDDELVIEVRSEPFAEQTPVAEQVLLDERVVLGPEQRLYLRGSAPQARSEELAAQMNLIGGTLLPRE